MNKTGYYKDLRAALASLMKKDKEYTIVNHTLPKNLVIKDHFHPEVDEWLIIDKGEFVLSIDFDSSRYGICRTTAFHFHKSTIHSLESLSRISYTVLRDGKDESIFLSDILKKRDAVPSVKDTCGQIRQLYDHKNMTIAYSTIDAGARSQRHYHKKHDEVYKIHKGEGIIHLGEEYYIQSMFKGDVINIPRNTLHYIENKGESKLEILVITRPRYDKRDVILG